MLIQPNASRNPIEECLQAEEEGKFVYSAQPSEVDVGEKDEDGDEFVDSVQSPSHQQPAAQPAMAAQSQAAPAPTAEASAAPAPTAEASAAPAPADQSSVTQSPVTQASVTQSPAATLQSAQVYSCSSAFFCQSRLQSGTGSILWTFKLVFVNFCDGLRYQSR